MFQRSCLYYKFVNVIIIMHIYCCLFARTVEIMYIFLFLLFLFKFKTSLNLEMSSMMLWNFGNIFNFKYN
jgi:hypothetical protein